MYARKFVYVYNFHLKQNPLSEIRTGCHNDVFKFVETRSIFKLTGLV